MSDGPEPSTASADRLIEVFTEAKTRVAGVEREQFLHASCGDDLQLRQHVAALLEADDEAGDFLRHPELIAPATVLTERPGDIIGRYKLLEKIGEGGCGVVQRDALTLCAQAS